MNNVELLLFIGLIFVVIGVILVGVSSLFLAKKDKINVKSEFAIGGFIGFIPFGFATSKSMLYLLILLMVSIVIFWFLFSRI